jgi:hypothetical protein
MKAKEEEQQRKDLRLKKEKAQEEEVQKKRLRRLGIKQKLSSWDDDD